MQLVDSCRCRSSAADKILFPFSFFFWGARGSFETNSARGSFEKNASKNAAGRSISQKFLVSYRSRLFVLRCSLSWCGPQPQRSPVIQIFGERPTDKWSGFSNPRLKQKTTGAFSVVWEQAYSCGRWNELPLPPGLAISNNIQRGGGRKVDESLPKHS